MVEGSAPVGNCRDHLMSNGSWHFAKYNLPSFHRNADFVNSALPPLCFFLNVGYLALPAKKLLNAVCKCLKLC